MKLYMVMERNKLEPHPLIMLKFKNILNKKKQGPY